MKTRFTATTERDSHRNIRLIADILALHLSSLSVTSFTRFIILLELQSFRVVHAQFPTCYSSTPSLDLWAPSVSFELATNNNVPRFFNKKSGITLSPISPVYNLNNSFYDRSSMVRVK